MSGLREYGRSAIGAVLERVGRGFGRVQSRKPLPYDLLESETEYLVVFDAPGAEKEDIQVRFDGTTVEVRIDRFREFHEGFEMRFPGRGLALSGSVTLPEDATVTDRDASATATLTGSGTLHVRVPRSPEGRPIDVDNDSAEADEGDDESGVDETPADNQE